MKWRFMGALMAVTLLILLVENIPLSGYLQQVEHDRIITTLERDAFVLAGRSEESLETPTPSSYTAVIDTARSYRTAGGARVVIVDAQGIAIVTSDDSESHIGDSYASRPEIITALTGEIASGHRYSRTLKMELLYVTVPVYSGGGKVFGAVRLTYPEQVVTDAVNSRLGLLWIVALTTVVLAGIVGLIFSSTVTRRLTMLKHATERFAEGKLDVRADERSGAPELRSLSRSFNAMAGRLNTLIEQQRTFAADASHQLRTPLTALRLRLERAREMLETEPAGAVERLAAAEAEADRLGNIIEGLLLLSRTEATSTPVEKVNVAKTARARVDQWQPLAQESRVHIRYEGPVTASILAVAMAAEQIIDNFVDNALSVSPEGTTIVVRVVKAGPDTSVHVLDEGPGLSEEDCNRAFDRFWRATSDDTGSGLGLAIVAQLALASGAAAQLAPRPNGGLDASVRFTTAR
ncbi:MAG: sensor histidine kinase [Lacisediminihabitans sp.]